MEDAGKIVKLNFQKQEENVLILFEVKTDPDEQIVLSMLKKEHKLAENGQLIR